MITFLSYIALIFLGIILIFFVLGFFVEKHPQKTHLNTTIINDTSYNLSAREEVSSVDSIDKVERYLEQKKNSSAEPLNPEDFYNYKKIMSEHKPL